MSKATRKRRNHSFTLKMKQKIIEEARQCDNIRATARKYKIYPCQIRRWAKNQKMSEVVKRNPKAKTVHDGKSVEYYDVEQELLVWIKELRSKDISVNTRQVIAKALSIDTNFHKGNMKALWKWIYVFLDRNNLSIRRITHQGQKLSGHLSEVHQRVVNSINDRFSIGGDLFDVDDSMFVNMDETAVYYESNPTTTINAKGENTIAIRCTGSNSKRMTVYLVHMMGQNYLCLLSSRENQMVELKRIYKMKLVMKLLLVVKKKAGWMNVQVGYGLKRFGNRMYMEKEEDFFYLMNTNVICKNHL